MIEEKKTSLLVKHDNCSQRTGKYKWLDMNGLLVLAGSLPRTLGNVIVLEKTLLGSNLKSAGNLKGTGKVFIESKRLKESTLAFENK